MFCMKILLILPKFHEKTLSHSGDIKLFPSGKVLSEERQLMKWVGIFQGGIFWVGIFRVEIFQGEFDGGKFFRGKFS